jgi:hypothetical protein
MEECTYLWGVNTSWGINMAESKRPLNQEDNQAPQPTEGMTFSDINLFEPLAVKFSTLWYSSDMNKQWQSNAIFHTYYNQLKISI